jgi:CheY-like chemotaxis protein
MLGFELTTERQRMSKELDQHATVLIVDDIEDNRRVMRNFLIQRHHCRVVEAADGQSALKLALRESPALILMDIRAPQIRRPCSCHRDA